MEDYEAAKIPALIAEELAELMHHVARGEFEQVESRFTRAGR
jgi:hypothetical protein